MRGLDFLNVAKSLVRSQSEPALRSAISRAYYALFNSAAQFLFELGFTVNRGPGTHGTVRNRLNNCGNRKMVEFAKTLDELRALRNEADYDMQSAYFDNQALCALHVANAELAAKILKDCRKEPIRSQIRKNIRDYDQRIAS